jgi:hypothetical protein
MTMLHDSTKTKNEVQKNSSKKLSGEALMGDRQYGIDPVD